MAKDSSLRITLRAYDHRLLDDAVAKIVATARRNEGKVVGPVPLPTKREVFTILRSPHVNKDSREQFERRTHKRIIIVYGDNAIKAIGETRISSSVNLEVKLN